MTKYIIAFQFKRSNFRPSDKAVLKFKGNMNRERLDIAIQKIRDYTMIHTELCTAHHFLFDLPLDKEAGRPEVVMMGINPGETEWDRQSYPGPTEETRSHDFHEKSAFGRSQGSDHWRRNAAFFANGKRVVFTELLFLELQR